MCGRYNVIDNPGIRELVRMLGVPLPEPRRNIAPGAKGQFVMEDATGRHLVEGYWSLLIEPKPTGTGYRPNPRYSTFNARADHLQQSRLWRKPFHNQRCIVPMTGFHEWVNRVPYNIYPQSGAIAMAGLWQQHDHGDETVFSFATITLPPHPRFLHIHPKSLPLILEPQDFDTWLDPDFHQVDAFQALLKTHIPYTLTCQPVNNPVQLQPAGNAEVVKAD